MAIIPDNAVLAWPTFWVHLVFPHDQARTCILRRNKVVLLVAYHIRKHTLLNWLIPVDVSLSHLVMIVAPRFLYCTVTLFPLVISKYLSCSSSNHHPALLSGQLCLSQLPIYWLPAGVFYSHHSSIFISWISIIRENLFFFSIHSYISVWTHGFLFYSITDFNEYLFCCL